MSKIAKLVSILFYFKALDVRWLHMEWKLSCLYFFFAANAAKNKDKMRFRIGMIVFFSPPHKVVLIFGQKEECLYHTLASRYFLAR